MKLKWVWAVLAIVLVFSFSASASEEGGVAGRTTIGGHMKLTLYDSAEGYSKAGLPTGLTDTVKSNQFMGFGFREFILYISHSLTDNFTLEFAPNISVRTGATPSLGTVIGAQKSASPKLEAVGIDEAFVVYNTQFGAPFDFDIKFGVFKPVFTMNYGHELFWEEQFNAGKFVCNGNLGQMHDMGFEFYKAFEIWEVMLPVYLYALNIGNYYLDNNRQPGLMAHIEPAWGPFRIGASFAAAKFDIKEQKWMFRWTGGASFNWKGIHARLEYAAGNWEKDRGDGTDARAEGFYGLVSWKALDWLRVLYSCEYAIQNFNGLFSHAGGPGDVYFDQTAGLNLFVTPSTILQFQVDVSNWRRRNDVIAVVFTRPTLGLRITF